MVHNIEATVIDLTLDDDDDANEATGSTNEINVISSDDEKSGLIKRRRRISSFRTSSTPARPSRTGLTTSTLLNPPPRSTVSSKQKKEPSVASSSRSLLEHVDAALKRKRKHPGHGQSLPSPKGPKNGQNQVSLTRSDKKRPHEIINLCDDEEEEEEVMVVEPQPKRQKVEEPPSDDDDYDTCHPGFDYYNNPNWLPSTEPLWVVPDPSHFLTLSMSHPSMSHTAPRPPPKKLEGDLVEKPFTWSPRTLKGKWIWDALSTPRFCNPHPYRPPQLRDQRSYTISAISQTSGVVAIASHTVGGHREDEDDPDRMLLSPESLIVTILISLQISRAAPPIEAQNREGNLQIYRNGSSRILHGHDGPVRRNRDDQAVTHHKYYTVNDVQFDPRQNMCMASSGNDCIVRFWEIAEDVTSTVQIQYKDVAYDLHYHPDEPILAVTCRDGCIHLHRNPGRHSTDSLLHVTPPSESHSTGAMIWGRECTSHILFASSEPREEWDVTGYHKAFDYGHQKLLYEFDAKEGGDAMALDPKGRAIQAGGLSSHAHKLIHCHNQPGEKLALFTLGPGSSNLMRLYDVRSKNARRPVYKASLEPFMFRADAQVDGEVSVASFSPDGTLLFIARNDNQVHVYDPRYLGRGPLHQYVHWGKERCVGANRFGVTQAKWVQGWGGVGLGIVSGGMDGCVRLWDVRQSSDDIRNGEVVVQTDYDISDFSLGDIYNNEKPLVIPFALG
ncbi:hypothetical protein EW146_g1268 [Bondarzewia mesenterica]|uniref:Uncharacterized protein n=1 Tax=Bondarzewia mesenterica TaxID=1095465 RepID=A0A4S4M4V1_9AGAM|nr:hypothetical protein EW146_g1268 [Bondarzewia mesenterica]